MNKEERIKRYGKAAWEKRNQQSRDWRAAHREEVHVINKEYRVKHSKILNAQSKEYHAEHRERLNAQKREYHAQHSEEVHARTKEWREANPEKVKEHNHEHGRKGGKHYARTLEYLTTGIPGERNRVRAKHRILYLDIKQGTPNTQIHHEWIPGTTNYRGVALVNKEAHRNGIIKVIKILGGEITIFTEKEIREQKCY